MRATFFFYIITDGTFEGFKDFSWYILFNLSDIVRNHYVNFSSNAK